MRCNALVDRSLCSEFQLLAKILEDLEPLALKSAARSWEMLRSGAERA